MFELFLNYIRSEEDHDPLFIRLTRNILIFVMTTTIILIPLAGGITGQESRNILAVAALATSFLVETIALIFTIRGNVLLAKIVVPIALIATITFIAYNTNGIRDTSFLGLPIVITVSAILLGRRTITLVTPMAVLGAVIVALNDRSLNRTATPVGLDDVFITPVLLIASSFAINLLIVRLNESTLRAQRSEQAQRQEKEELHNLRTTLEKRVHERTVELEVTNQVVEKRARQFQAVTRVMNAISAAHSLDELLPLVTQVISEQFNVYHTGVFLLDKKQELAVLRAANSVGGQKMLERKHNLPIGQTGIVGFVTATGQPRIALDVGMDSAYFDNPDLPNTRSEIALPLNYGGQIIGALDVQSLEANAFHQEDVAVLTTLADQVAIAINNALTLEDAQKALAEARSAIGQLTQEAWQILRPEKLGLGFSFTEAGLKPIVEPTLSKHMEESVKKGKTILHTEKDKKTYLSVPIRLREHVIGVMQLNTRGQYQFTQDDAEIAEAVSERLSLAIETATLLQSTQQRADLEKVTAVITSKVSSSSRMETILQTAAQELSRALGGSDVLVQIEPAALRILKS